MRATFLSSLYEAGQSRDDAIFLTGDLGYKILDGIREGWGNRFYDVGVAEANMASLAAGLAIGGKTVYCYSIVPFLVMRAFEQIRVDVAAHNLKVRFIGVGGGFSYGFEGFTHFGLEDLALMRLLPNMSVVVPADPLEAARLAKLSLDWPGPLYIRLGKSGEPSIHADEPGFQIGRPIVLKSGREAVIVAIGSMVYCAIDAARQLEDDGISATVINFHTLKPLDTNFINDLAKKHDVIVTAEEHYRMSGLGSVFAECLLEFGYKGRFCRIGIPDELDGTIGSCEFLRDHYGLNAAAIRKSVLDMLHR